MNARFLVWGLIAVIAGTGVVGGLCLYPALAPEDGDGLARSLVLRASTMLLGFLFLTLAILSLDTITPGWWLEDIEKNAMAEAVLVSALVMALALIFIYS